MLRYPRTFRDSELGSGVGAVAAAAALALSLLLFTLELRWAIIPEWESKIQQRRRLAER